MIIYFYASNSFKAYVNGQLMYDGPNYQLALDSLIPF